jgi:hypothetical protein
MTTLAMSATVPRPAEASCMAAGDVSRDLSRMNVSFSTPVWGSTVCSLWTCKFSCMKM